MIDSLALTFSPKTKEEFQLFESILSKYKYKRELVIEEINEYVKLYIFTQKKFIQFKVFHINEFLGLNEITNKDYIQFESKFNKTIEQFNLSLDKLRLTRLDLKLDTKLTNEEIQEYLYVFSKLRQKFYSLQKRVYWNTDRTQIETVYYKGAKFNINIYDKQAQLNKRGIFDPFYNDILRIELQVKTTELTNYCNIHNISKTLINFWHSSVREDFFNSILVEKFLYAGDYFDIKNVKKQTKDMKSSTQQKIIHFLKQVAEKDITEAINTLARGTATKYIKELSARNINPVTIKNFDYLLGIKSILEEKTKAI